MNHHLPQFPVDFPELKSAFAVSFREWVSYRSMEAHRNKRASEMIRSDSDPFLWKSRIMWRKGNLWLSVQLKGGGVEIGKSIRVDTGIPSKHSKAQFPSHWLIDFPWFTQPISVIHSTNEWLLEVRIHDSSWKGWGRVTSLDKTIWWYHLDVDLAWRGSIWMTPKTLLKCI